MTFSESLLTSMQAARFAVGTLIEDGVREVVLCPGSRSAPLAYALAEAETRGQVRVHIRIDERDAGFTALGLSLATSRPVAIVTTSGTAVGELLPAVMEANHAAVPLVVVSADRPEELRGTGANQTTDQAGLFGVHVRYCVDIPAGQDPTPEVRRALLAGEGLPLAGSTRAGVHAVDVSTPTPASRALRPAVQLAARGPIHINLAFRDPLVPDTEGSREDPTEAPGSGVPGEPDPATVGDLSSGTVLDELREAELENRRTVVIAGHDATAIAERFARMLGLPLLAEPSSNARFGPNAIGPYRVLIPEFEARIDRVVVFGRPTLNRQVGRLLAHRELPPALYVPEPVAWFDAGHRRDRVITELGELAGFAGRGPAGWLDEWRAAAQRATGIIDEATSATTLTGVELARTVWSADTGPLVLGSSNAIRDVDLAGTPGRTGRAVYANRGLAGIDGTLATATGIALGTSHGVGERTTVLLGDVTFLHDVGGLFVGAGETVPVMDLVVLNDGGGAIFSTLEHGSLAEQPEYAGTVERYFATPHGVDLRALADAYGVDYVRVEDRRALGTVLASGPMADSAVRRRIVDVRIDRVGVRGLHQRIMASVART
ncbi:MAG: 2-succinyl-5-enolpyruvyl-6-hydroxy-3-cyclohexene-1-carboxylic-acid synthase [Arthrobacter sp.]|nr:2-succinyl-5-enolpyruvyl-6-hydroxy-3-cyclohexene-1-carboxylic-acid synthase [Micrococcaceae bacterium]MDN5878720.1 2-succinyl-5-enolpyruvyl-6-hydroxy-3-cyclohexene-1-carboxylic-acid synthase [Micrococcaceae bacterium]MDN5886244.1 2-succinyl-5-enolpyruvyl-6-hydroxy-3-cyclohexene-1-carboxylic-acid synthase [Micrococcaceae bacterium]MDN5904042.1 2-succinyl-5-enolpyruvyl-6-hydroxy-3-cyclohexene-1-carboxylic-acid synthase [Micrococcaceae bacterium]MDN6170647.1 2-succinyl-5-enolpyruvyl-6-hydroxy-3